MSVARDGWPIIAGLLGVGGLLAVFRQPVPSAVLIALGLFTAFFFRDPERLSPQDPHLVLSPADGKVVQVGPASSSSPLGEGSAQVSIFLSIFDVHVNRAPIGGRIAAVEYRPGAFLPAFDHEASLRNEQNSVTIEDGSTRVVFKQIAGLIARRIVFRKKVDERVVAGERVGLIKFGSRVDVFLPAQFRVRVKRGDRVHGGTSVLAERAEA